MTGNEAIGCSIVVTCHDKSYFCFSISAKCYYLKYPLLTRIYAYWFVFLEMFSLLKEIYIYNNNNNNCAAGTLN